MIEIAVYLVVHDDATKTRAVALIETPNFAAEVAAVCESKGLEVSIPVVSAPLTKIFGEPAPTPAPYAGTNFLVWSQHLVIPSVLCEPC